MVNLFLWSYLILFIIQFKYSHGAIGFIGATNSSSNFNKYSKSYAQDSVIIRFKPTAVARTVAAAGIKPHDPVLTASLSKLSSTNSSVLPFALHHRSQLFKIVDGSSVESKVKELRAHPDIALVEPNYHVRVLATPSDTQYIYQWHLPKIAAPVAWDTITGSNKIKVCVIDSGVRIDHPDVAANVIKGWNVINGLQEPDVSNYNDTLGHGTHVAGLVAAVGNNARGVSGSAWQMNLLICKFIQDSGSGSIWDAIVCMRLCEAEGALVYSNSWGGVDTPDSLGDEIAALQSSNGLFVAAAGNNGTNVDITPSYPAAYNKPNQLTVAATTSADTLAGFSNYGPTSIHIASPGEGILSTTHDGEYGVLSGTSMATPIVSGAAALLQAMAINAQGTPLDPVRVKQILMETVDPMIWGPSSVASGGRLNIAKAVVQLRAELGGYNVPALPPPAVPPVPLMPQSPRAPEQPPSPPPPMNTINSSSIVPPECGTSPLRGQPASQSSTANSSFASYAVNGDCRNDMSSNANLTTSCSATDKNMNNPWWTASLPQASQVEAVSITTRADCCSTAIGGALILVGSSNWTDVVNGLASATTFSQCGQVPIVGIPLGQRLTVVCNTPLIGTQIVISLNKLKTSLILCEVDVTLGNGVGGSSGLSSVRSTAYRRALKTPNFVL